MSAATFLSEPVAAPIGLSGVRVSGGVSVRCSERLAESRVVDVRERDGYKVRFPRRSAPPEAVIINTGGGLAGGDDVLQSIEVTDNAALTVTTQAAERAYRSLSGAITKLDVQMNVGEGAELRWLPQETILFDKSRLDRRLTADIAVSAKLLVAETIVFGRAAMGEILTSGLFKDTWRIRRGGKLVFAENIKLGEETFHMVSSSAIADGAHAIMTVVFVANDAEDRLAGVRRTLRAANFECAASAWNGMLVVRGLAAGTEEVRNTMAALVTALGSEQLPRVWWT